MNFDEQAMNIPRGKQGILETFPRAVLKTTDDLSVLYTPGVAQPCREITKDPDLSFDLTCRGNMIAVVSDGTRVLGLGDIGPEAAMPVMEGKSILFKVFGGVNAVPICLDTKDPQAFIETVKRLQPSFAGINLEDISSPKCYEIEETLKREMDIPVFHDDQHGTAIAALAGVIGALRFVKKDLKTARIVINGAGAAGASSSASSAAGAVGAFAPSTTSAVNGQRESHVFVSFAPKTSSMVNAPSRFNNPESTKSSKIAGSSRLAASIVMPASALQHNTAGS